MNTYENTAVSVSMETIMTTLNKTAEISLQNTQSMAVVLKRLETSEQLMNGLSNTMNNVSLDLTEVKSDIENLKLNEEVTTTQQETIIETATRRVMEILGTDLLDRHKYFRIFIKRLYTDAKRNAGLGSKISRTKKGDFQRVIDFIEAWTPSCGCFELKKIADKNAETRRIAFNEGYID